MANIIPPLVSDSPPPPPSEEDEDDEFDDFKGSNDISYGCDNFSLTPSPELFSKNLHKENLTIGNKNEPAFNFPPILPDKNKDISENLSIGTNNESINRKSDYTIPEEYNASSDDNLFHNKLISKDNIPSQFIIENVTSKHENDATKCDSSSDNLSEQVPDEVHFKNEDVINTSLSNGFSSLNTFDDDDDGGGGNTFNRVIEYTQDPSLVADHFDFTDKEEILGSEKSYKHSELFPEKNNESCNYKEPSGEEFTEQLCDNKIENTSLHLLKHSKENDDLFDTKKHNLNCSSANKSETESIDDDFGNFVSHPTEEKVELRNIENTMDDGAELSTNNFASFSHILPTNDNFTYNSSSSDPSIHNKIVENFANFDSYHVEQESDDKEKSDNFPSFQDGDDDFGEFTSTTIESTNSPKPFLLLNEKEAFKKTKEIIADIFIPLEKVTEEIQYFEIGKGDFIFTQLQDVTDTPALQYHWSKSASQKLLLKALNIDSRNILYGHSWNSSVPRFAANMGAQPLEPTKMESLTPTPVDTIPCSVRSETVDIPNAQFDWTSSGLVNPLDFSQTTLLDLEQLVTSLDIPNTNPKSQHVTSLPMNVDEDWDIWLKYSPNESTKSNPQTETDDYEEFTSFQSSEPPQLSTGWPSLPLRETYISDVPQAHIDVDVCLQPTIVTPEMPRKRISNNDDDVGYGEILSDDKARKNIQENDTEFNEFQTDEISSKTIQENDVEFNEFQTDEKGNKNIQENDVEFNQFQIVYSLTDSINMADTNKEDENVQNNNAIITKETVVPNDADDDEFTDFHSSVPAPPSILAPVLLPLQPTQVYATPVSTQINWPDPGITQDELKRFEEVFSSPLVPEKDEKSIREIILVAQPQNVKENKKRTDMSLWSSGINSSMVKKIETKEELKKLESKQTSVEDDEWSDFVSIQKPSPVHKTKFIERTETASPDLPLSVLNLGNIQPTKQPIPVITPQGLVQTKLSTNINPVNQHKLINRSNFEMPPIQPSIISNQYASQAYGFGNSMHAKHTNKKCQEDDEWGEFVSNPLPPQYQNSTTTIEQYKWNSFMPNSRSNSDHMLNQTSGRSVNTILQRKNNSAGLVLPELDFLGTRERSSVPRKK